jgi:hypothetical protein
MTLLNHCRITITAITIVLGALSAGCRSEPKSLSEIIARNTAAMGGAALIESVHSIQIQLHITDPGFEVEGVYRTMRPGRMRIDVMAGGKHVFTEAFNGQRGWQWKGEGEIVDEKAEATAALKHGVELPGKLFGLHEMESRGHHVTLLNREKIADTMYDVIQVTFSDGYTTSLYLDPKTSLITRRRDFRPLHVDIDPRPTTIETVFSDFREIAGLKFPFASADTDLQTGKVLEQTRIIKVEVNPSIDPSIFDRL